MPESLQKSAMPYRELDLPHYGLLDPTGFAQHFQTHCYEPLKDLRPFVAHIWTLRWDLPPDVVYKPTEILSGPSVNIFCMTNRASIYGVTSGNLNYQARGKGLIAGVKFRPGGFYPFLKQPLSRLNEQVLPLHTVLPGADSRFIARLLVQDDSAVVTTLHELLRATQPVADMNIELISQIIARLDQDKGLQTVEAVCRAFGKSDRTLQHLFRQYVGVGVKWVLMRNRLLEAAKQAQRQARPGWAAVAFDLGYSSQAHFAADFKTVVGLSPSQYLKVLRASQTPELGNV